MIRDAGRLAGIPGVLIHGRLDLSCPVDTAWTAAIDPKPREISRSMPRTASTDP